MSLVRKIMALAAAVLFAAGLWVAPAHAAVTPGGGDGPGCYANGCDGQDPVAMGCWNDAYVASSSIIYYTVFDIGYVDNWYSPSCGTNWAQVFSTNDAWVYVYVGSYDAEIFRVQGVDGGAYVAENETSSNGTWTNMLYARDVQACAEGNLISRTTGAHY